MSEQNESPTAGPWWYEFPDDPVKSDFRNFLFLVWEHLGLPSPTPGQYEMAYFMQWGYGGYALSPDTGKPIKVYDAAGAPYWDSEDTVKNRLAEVDPTGRADILEGFRGIGKSYIAAAFVLWLLLRDPVDTKVLVASAAGTKAREFVAQSKSILMTMDILAHLRPRKDQRDMVDRFDVNGASISQSPSLKAAGITGQITGSRATAIIGDDIEIESNSKTEEARKSILKAVNEFDAIKVPGRATILLLGTPQTEESVYNTLIRERGYQCFALPGRYPKPEKRKGYQLKTHGGVAIDILAPFLRAVDSDPSLVLKPTDPTRFNNDELISRESRGASFFALQFMLDTSLSDAERYPLKQQNLIVMSCNPFKAPTVLQWGRHTDRKNIREDIPNVGFTGDYFMGPLFVDPEWRDYTASVLFVDPSGGGADEVAWAVVKELHGMLHVIKVNGISGKDREMTKEAVVEESMRLIARDAALFRVNEVVVEPNYGGPMWIAAFNPMLAKEGKGFTCTVKESEWAKGMKESRIIDTLEPVIGLHRLVVDESIARDQTLMYQLTHIAKERNCLRHDDRIDALAGAVARFTDAMMLDSQGSRDAQQEEELNAELEDFVEACLATRRDGMRTGYSRRRNSAGERNEVAQATRTWH